MLTLGLEELRPENYCIFTAISNTFKYITGVGIVFNRQGICLQHLIILFTIEKSEVIYYFNKPSQVPFFVGNQVLLINE